MNRVVHAMTGSFLHWKVATKEPHIYLTFDDGPVPGITEKVLEILDQYQIKATFFMVGENIVKHPEIFDKVIQNGHMPANHTYHHLHGWRTATSEYVRDVRATQKMVGNRLFRPPYGKISPAQIRKLHKQYAIIMWSALSGDYDPRRSGENCLARSLRQTRPGAIVVFHDNIKAEERMLHALPRYIEKCLEQGYIFKILDDRALLKHS